MSVPYAYLCRDCDHLASSHLLVKGGDLRKGPYRCKCGCEQPQDAPWAALTKAMYESRFSSGGQS